jgi:hypothetical protein
MTCPLAVDDATLQTAFWQGLWQGIFQLAALALVAVWVNFVYRRYKELSTARQELLDEIDEFTIRLYRPRKMYQAVLEDSPGLLAACPDERRRQARRIAVMHRALAQLVGAIGRLRSLQVKMVPLYGYHVELFGHYLAIWRYMKEVRHRMERCEPLYSRENAAEGSDAFYRLIDTFRYRVMVEKVNRHPPALVQPPADVLAHMRKRGDDLYAQYFGSTAGQGGG